MPNRQQASHKAPSRWPSRRQQWVRTPDGVDISVREWGNPEGWPILFVHGLAQSHLSFLPQFASELADRHRLVAYDLRGHGESAKPLDPVVLQRGPALGGRTRSRHRRRRRDQADPGRLVARRTGASPIPDPLRRPSHRRTPFRRHAPVRRSVGDRPGIARQHRRPPGHAGASASMPISRSCAHAFFASRRKTILPSLSPTTSSSRRRFARRSRAGRLGSRKRAPRWRRSTVPTLIAHGRDDALILPAAAEMTAAAIKGSPDFLVRRLRPLPILRACRALQPRARRVRRRR